MFDLLILLFSYLKNIMIYGIMKTKKQTAIMRVLIARILEIAVATVFAGGPDGVIVGAALMHGTIISEVTTRALDYLLEQLRHPIYC